MGKIKISKQTEPTTPDTGEVVIYVDSADGKAKFKDEDGDVVSLASEEMANAGLSGKLDSLLFGDGSDGDVTITTTITLTRDMYYNNLTITSPGVLNPNGYRFFVKGTLSGDGKIQRNGNNGSGQTGGAALNQGTLNADIGGGNGGNGGAYGGSFPAGAGVAGTSPNPAYTNLVGANGGPGGTSTGPGAPEPGAGGIGGTATRGSLYNIGGNPFNRLFRACNPASFVIPTFTQYKSAPGAAGGGGGSAGQYQGSGGVGGGGGGNGGFIWASINIVDRTGTWEAIGGNGANGGNCNPTYQTTSSAGGGGGGGCGGTIFLMYRTLTSMGTETLTGGTKGAPGSIGRQPTTFASDGPSGVSIKIQI